MAKREPKIDMTWREFGEYLLETEDLDPVYVMLASAEDDGAIDERTLKRFLLAYWCYYHCGVASRIAEHSKLTHYYSAMWQGVSEKWPRGMERRYFYGKMAERTIHGLEAALGHGRPEDIVDDMCAHRKFQDVFDKVVSYAGFGPWMGWKVADMAERVLDYPVDFTGSHLGIYKDPVQAAAFIRFGDKHHAIEDAELESVCDRMGSELYEYLAPPFYDRPVNVQEVETVLCKYKAHCFGHYPLGNDTHHVAKGMIGWGDLAEALSAYMPPLITAEMWSVEAELA